MLEDTETFTEISEKKDWKPRIRHPTKLLFTCESKIKAMFGYSRIQILYHPHFPLQINMESTQEKNQKDKSGA